MKQANEDMVMIKNLAKGSAFIYKTKGYVVKEQRHRAGYTRVECCDNKKADNFGCNTKVLPCN